LKTFIKTIGLIVVISLIVVSSNGSCSNCTLRRIHTCDG